MGDGADQVLPCPSSPPQPHPEVLASCSAKTNCRISPDPQTGFRHEPTEGRPL